MSGVGRSRNHASGKREKPTLSQVCSRRKISLERFACESGCENEENLRAVCDVFGAEPPSSEELALAFPKRTAPAPEETKSEIVSAHVESSEQFTLAEMQPAQERKRRPRREQQSTEPKEQSVQ